MKRVLGISVILLAVVFLVFGCGGGSDSGGGNGDDGGNGGGGGSFAALSGRVLEADLNGNPTSVAVSGAIVELYSDQALTMLVKSFLSPDGGYGFDNILLGSYWIRARHPSRTDLEPFVSSVALSSPVDFSLDLIMVRQPDLNATVFSGSNIEAGTMVTVYNNGSKVGYTKAVSSSFTVTVPDNTVLDRCVIAFETQVGEVYVYRSVSGASSFAVPVGTRVNFGTVSLGGTTGIASSTVDPASYGVVGFAEAQADFSGSWLFRRTVTYSEIAGLWEGYSELNNSATVTQTGSSVTVNYVNGYAQMSGVVVGSNLYVFGRLNPVYGQFSYALFLTILPDGSLRGEAKMVGDGKVAYWLTLGTR